MKKYYLAYGSNLNVIHMKQRSPYSKLVGKTILNDHCLVFKGSNQNGFLTIEKREQSIVPLGIYEITDYDEYQLDTYEGYPSLYRKETIQVLLNGEPIEGIIYIMSPIYSYAIPRMDYLQVCSEGYEQLGFNRAILSNALETTINNIGKKLIK